MNYLTLLLFTTSIILCTTDQIISQNKSALQDGHFKWQELPGKDYGDMKWYEVQLQPDANFYDIKKAFHKEWDGKDYESGKMYKQYKRWEWAVEGKGR